MGLTIIKRLLVWLSVVALIGGSWAQAFAQNASHSCTMSLTAAVVDMAASNATACVDNAAQEMDSGKNTSVDCSQNCVAPLNFAVSFVSLHFEHLKQVFEPAAPVIMDGRIPVGAENFIRIDLTTESHDHRGRWSRCYPLFSTW